MRWLRPARPGPKTDMQNRLRYVESRAEEIRNRHAGMEVQVAKDVSELADLVKYLCVIVDKHLRDGET